MKMTLAHAEAHDKVVPWQEGEVVTVQIKRATGDAYEVQTVETFQPDLKERHAAEIAVLNERHLKLVEALAQAGIHP